MPSIVARKYQRIKAFNEMRNGDRFFTHDQLVDLGVTEKQIDKLMRVFLKKRNRYKKYIYIDKLDEKYQDMIPLKQVYIPVSKDEASAQE